MKFTAEIDIMPLKALLDPQGKAVEQGMQKIGLNQIENVRIGKHITLQLEAADKAEAEKITKEACEKILANPIMESYEYRIN